jgi:hypothetical protein
MPLEHRFSACAVNSRTPYRFVFEVAMVQNCHFCRTSQTGGAEQYDNNARATVFEVVIERCFCDLPAIIAVMDQ